MNLDKDKIIIIEPPKEMRGRGIRSKRSGRRKAPKVFQPPQSKPTRPPKKPGTDRNQLPRGLRIDTTTGEGANITKFSKGGSCRGAGAAIKGTKFQGVF